MRKYFYIDANLKQQGPCSIEELRDAGISRETKVWSTDLADWTDAGQVEELNEIFEYAPPAMPSAQPAAPQVDYSQMQRPNSYLAWSIIVTILCCWPLGIPAIIYAARVDSQWMRGEYEEAMRSSRQAKNFTIASAIAAFVFVVIWMIFYGAIFWAALASKM